MCFAVATALEDNIIADRRGKRKTTSDMMYGNSSNYFRFRFWPRCRLAGASEGRQVERCLTRQ